jgi:hypothetical protein
MSSHGLTLADLPESIRDIQANLHGQQAAADRTTCFVSYALRLIDTRSEPPASAVDPEESKQQRFLWLHVCDISFCSSFCIRSAHRCFWLTVLQASTPFTPQMKEQLQQLGVQLVVPLDLPVPLGTPHVVLGRVQADALDAIKQIEHIDWGTVYSACMQWQLFVLTFFSM